MRKDRQIIIKKKVYTMRRSIQFSLSTRHIVHSAINIAARRRSLKKKENKKIQTSSSFFFFCQPHSSIPERFLFVETFAFTLFYLCVFVVGIEPREIVGAFCRRVFELLLTTTESRVPSPKRRRKSQDLVNSRLYSLS